MHSTIVGDVGGSKADQTLACNVIEQLSKIRLRIPGSDPLRYAFEHASEQAFRLRISRGINVITGDDVRQLAAQGRRVSNVRLLPNRPSVHIEMRRSADASSMVGIDTFVEQKERKVRHVSIDWAKSDINSEDDQYAILSIIDEVYNIQRRIPRILCWIEPVTAGGTSPDASIDASESTASIADADVVAYAVCFTGLPEFSGSFFNYLHSKYDGVLLQSQLWLQPPKKSGTKPILALLLRKSNQTIKNVGAVADLYVPRGNPIIEAPATKKRIHSEIDTSGPLKKLVKMF